MYYVQVKIIWCLWRWFHARAQPGFC